MSPAEPSARPIPSGGIARGRLEVPPSKSVTQRALNLALLGSEPMALERPLLSEDTRRFITALEALGWRVRESAGNLSLAPGRPVSQATIDCGHNGTMLRFLTAALSAVPGRWLLDGSSRLRERPLSELAAALRSLGARLEFPGRSGHAPVSIVGGSLSGGHAVLDAGRSSQFASALLMAGVRASAAVTLQIAALTSAPYLELTLDLMRRFGASVEHLAEATLRVQPTPLAAGRFRVEGDFSAAAYPAAAAALTGGQVQLEALRPDSRQGDRAFLELLGRMGARLEWRDESLIVTGTGRLHAVDADLADTPDQVPTLAALAPFAAGLTRIRNVPHLRLKESDRLHSMATELTRLGAEVDELPDGLIIDGTWADCDPPAAPVVVDSHGDHRVAMSLALVGLRRAGLAVADPGVVSKSYPAFWRDLDQLLAR